MLAYRLTMKQGPTVGKSFELTKDIVTLGRDLTNDFIINDAEMSRHHSRLTRQGGGYVVEDLGSTNGTFVNSARVTGVATLKTGDVVSLGDTVTLVFEAVQAESAATIVAGALSTNAPRPSNVASYTPPPPPQSISAPEKPRPSAPEAEGGSRNWLTMGCGCLAVGSCVVLSGLLVFAWLAPASFWRSLGF